MVCMCVRQIVHLTWPLINDCHRYSTPWLLDQQVHTRTPLLIYEQLLVIKVNSILAGDLCDLFTRYSDRVYLSCVTLTFV